MIEAHLRQRPAWHDDSFPELREGPPWVMAEMVASQPDLAAPIFANRAAGQISRLINVALDRGEPIVVTGCGTSEHGARAVTELLDAALRVRGVPGGRVETRQALEQSLDPRVGGCCLAISHDGGTRATILALEAARETGATTALVTARAASPITREVDEVLVTPALDRSWCHTVAYTSAILAGAAIAGTIADMSLTAAPFESFMRAVLACQTAADQMAIPLHERRFLLAVGSGADRVTASELALKIEEGARRPVIARDLETLLHGHLVACDATSGLIMIATDPRGGERRNRRLALAATAAGAIGITRAAIISPEVARYLPDVLTPAGRLVLPTLPIFMPPFGSLLGGALALQMLTLALAAPADTNPDLIRREEEPYRVAARVAEQTSDW